MTIALSLLALLAIAAAIGAASRVQRQMAEEKTQGQPSSQSAVQEPASGQTSYIEPDRDWEVPSPSSEVMITDLSDLLSGIPLAASLSVTDVLHPPEVTVALHPTGEESSDVTPSVNLLSELEHLDHSDHHAQIAHLSRYVEHSDGVMRAAAVFALGELLAKCDRAESEEVSTLLHQFGQDANLQVRQQTIAALGKIRLH